MPLRCIKSVRLFDGVNVQTDCLVVFDSESGFITDVTRSGELPVDAEIIDGSGCTLLPGLIDAHVHVHALHLPKGQDHSQVLKQPLKCGVTTICDMHSDPPTIHKFRQDIQSELKNARSSTGTGTVELADLKSALYGATIEGGWPKPIVLGHDPTEELKSIVATWPSVTPETAEDFVSNHKKNGADYIKLMQENCCSLALPTNSIPVASVELQSAVVKAAHDSNLLVVGHATSLESTEIVLKSGADGLTHTFIDQSPTDAIVPMYKKNNAFVIPTLVVLSSLTGDEQELREQYARLARSRGLIDEFTHENMTSAISLKAEHAKIQYAYETVRLFREHGIAVAAGTDSAAGLKGTAVGPSLWMELSLYVDKCGYSPLEALRSATSVVADTFKFNDRGRILKGRRADLLLVKGDPTTDLSTLWADKAITGVWKQGLRAV